MYPRPKQPLECNPDGDKYTRQHKGPLGKIMKKLLSFLLTLTLFASIVTISSFAFDIPANSESCTIKKNEAYSYSNY